MQLFDKNEKSGVSDSGNLSNDQHITIGEPHNSKVTVVDNRPIFCTVSAGHHSDHSTEYRTIVTASVRVE